MLPSCGNIYVDQPRWPNSMVSKWYICVYVDVCANTHILYISFPSLRVKSGWNRDESGLSVWVYVYTSGEFFFGSTEWVGYLCIRGKEIFGKRIGFGLEPRPMWMCVFAMCGFVRIWGKMGNGDAKIVSKGGYGAQLCVCFRLVECASPQRYGKESVMAHTCLNRQMGVFDVC